MLLTHLNRRVITHFFQLRHLMTHRSGQWSERFVKLCFIEFKGSIDKRMSTRVHNTNSYKYKGLPEHFA